MGYTFLDDNLLKQLWNKSLNTFQMRDTNATLLWTNNSPTSDFASSTITCSSSIDNYRYIIIEWKMNKTFEGAEMSTVQNLMYNSTPTSAVDLTKITYNYGITEAGGAYIRNINRVANSHTQLTFTDCVYQRTNNSYTTANYSCIPVRIYGIKKELPYSPVIEEQRDMILLWKNYNNYNTAFAEQTVDLIDDISKFKYIIIEYLLSQGLYYAEPSIYTTTVKNQYVNLTPTISSDVAKLHYTAGITGGGYEVQDRIIKRIANSNVSLKIMSATVTDDSSSTTSTSVLIPRAIYGTNTLSGNQNTSMDILRFYPIGSIYMSVNSTDPGDIFGGTWERIEGRFLLGATNGLATTDLTDAGYSRNTSYGTYYTYNNTSGTSVTRSITPGKTNYSQTGGEVKHTLTVSEMPAHQHSGTSTNNLTAWWGSGSAIGVRAIADGSGNDSFMVTNQSTGGGSSHNNMPPYFVVYMWQRTA